MKNNRSNFYINNGAIPSNEYGKNKDTRATEFGIETKKSFDLAGQEAQQVKRASWLLKKNRVSGTRIGTSDRKSNERYTSMALLRQYGDAHSLHSLNTEDSL